jgi:spore coat polysaccharide biosynthesis protein SpsF
MLKTLGIVQACCAMRNFHGKVARKLGGRSVLELVIRSLTESQQLDGVIVLACDDAAHCCVQKLVPPDIPVFIGSQSDALGRFTKAVEHFAAEAVLRVRGDNLFIDPGLIDRLVTSAESANECDYATYCSHAGRTAMLSSVGIYAEWIRAKALRKAAVKATDPADRAQVTRYIYTHPEKFQLRLLPAPAEIDRDDVRLTIEQEEDWEHVLTLYEALGSDRLDCRRIADLLDHHPALRRRMAALNRDFAHAEW